MARLQILFRSNERRRVLRAFGLGLIQGGLKWARVDFGEHIALFYLLAFCEQNLLQLAINLSLNVDGEHCLHRAETGEIDRDVPSRGGRHGDRDRRAGSEARPGVRNRAYRTVPVERTGGCQQCDAGSTGRKRAPACATDRVGRQLHVNSKISPKLDEVGGTSGSSNGHKIRRIILEMHSYH